MINQKDFDIVDSKYPHIGLRLKTYWGHREFDPYINDLMKDTRDGMRQGFPPDVAAAILRISQDHVNKFPHLVQQITDIWGLGK